ncbi:hypothetical protein [Mesorhizobium sp. A623]
MTIRLKTDDEMQRAAQRNYFDPREADPAPSEISHSTGYELKTDSLLRELETIDATSGPDDDESLGDSELYELHILNREEERKQHRQMISEAVVKYSVGGPVWKANRKNVRANGAKDARDRRAEEKGAPLRRYRQGLDAPTEDQRKAEKAESARIRYAEAKKMEDGRDVQRYNDLSSMTPEDIAAHKREQNRLRKADERRRKRIVK